MRGWLIVFCLIPLLSVGQHGANQSDALHTLSDYTNLFAYSIRSQQEPQVDRLLSLAQKLESKKVSYRNEKKFLKYVFAKSHQQLLKKYTDYATFTETLNSGTYNCLTATITYSLLLNYLNIPHEVIETNYHIFIIATTKHGDVLLETTDRLNGFVENAQEIEQRINDYKSINLTLTDNQKYYYQYDANLYHRVSINELIGLQYYNMAVIAYNQQELITSIKHLDEATDRYHSPRTDEFSRIIQLTIQESKLDLSAKESYLNKLRSIRQKQQSNVMASSQVRN